MCKSWCELIIAVVVIVFAVWESVYSFVGKWILLIAGIVLLIHSFMCKKCFSHSGNSMKDVKSLITKKKK